MKRVICFHNLSPPHKTYHPKTYHPYIALAETMKNLTPKDIEVLHLLSRHLEGLPLAGVQSGAFIERKEYAYSRLMKLDKKGWIGKSGQLYFLVGDIKNISPVGSAKPITRKTQRPHAFLVAAGLYRTSSDRAKATLEAMQIPYKIGGLRELCFSWKGITFKAYLKRIVTFPAMPEMPLSVPIGAIKERAAQQGAKDLEALLDATGLRCTRDPLGRLVVEVRYWENGYPENGIAEESLKDGESRKVYSYDRVTGRPSSWADSSIDPFKELETNSEVLDGELKEFMQAIDNAEIKPYGDEIATRRHITELYNLMGRTAVQVNQLAEQLNVHAPYLNAWKVAADATEHPAKRERARKAIQDLGQRRLL